MTEKFKAGDRVIFSSAGHWKGVTGTVTGYRCGYCRVKCDEDSRYADGSPVLSF